MLISNYERLAITQRNVYMRRAQAFALFPIARAVRLAGFDYRPRLVKRTS